MRFVRTLACCAALFPLVACGGGSPFQPTTPRQGASLQARSATPGSWMDETAKGQRLLYVSDDSKDAVFVYGASSNKLVGKHAIEEPLGECVDKANNVWIIDNEGLVEYAHGGTKPIGSIDMYDFYAGGFNAYSCAVDPTTGNIAVSIVNRYQGNDAGLILICTSTAECSLNEQRARAYVYFVSYDKKGDLYADGVSRDSGAFWMVKQPKGGSFATFTIRGATITTPGALVNADGVFSVGGGSSSGNSTIYQVSPNGKVNGTTLLSGANDCHQFTIQGNPKLQRLTCPNLDGKSVTKYNYPAGGAPVATIKGKFSRPFAAVYSE
jgi:hypothetical protein